jgi:hypothetical protein
MTKRWSRMFPILFGVSAISAGAEAQTSLTGVILHGASTRSGSAQPGTPTILTPGVRVESPRASWTEIAFSDGSSVVLDPGAVFTLQGIEKDPDSGHLVIRAASGRGRVRIETSDGVEVLLTTPGAQVRVVAATAIVNAGRGGSATLISGRRLVVQRGAEEDVVRRPGFAVVFDNGTRRETRPELAEAVDTFAPVTVGGANFAGVEVASASTSTGGSNAVLPTGLNANQGGAVPAPTTAANTGGNGGTGTNAGTGGGGAGGGGTGGGGAGGGSAGGGSAGGGGAGGGGAPAGAGGGGAAARTPLSFALASAVINTSAGAASSIAAPGNDTTSAAAAQTGQAANADPTDTDPGATTRTQNIVSTVFSSSNSPSGSARVRILPPPNGFNSTGTRADTGQVVGTGQNMLIDQKYQNVLTTPLPQPTLNLDDKGPQPGSQVTFYDATARAGYLVLTNAGANQQPSIWIGDSLTPATSVTTCTDGSSPCTNITYPAIVRIPINSSATNVTDVVLPGSAAPANQIPVRLAGPDQDHSGLVIYAGPDITLNSNPASVSPFVYIIDKVTSGIAARGIPQDERFFAIGGTSVGDGLQKGLPQNGGAMPAGTVMRFAISDLLNPTTAGGLSTTRPLPDQFNNPANRVLPGAFSSFNAFRPEETFAISPGSRGDTQLWVVSGDATRSNVASRADLQIVADGRSSGSVSIGTIAPLNGSANGPLVLGGQTVGSTRLNTSQFSAAINANFGSLATGADGQSVYLLGGSTLNNGQISYFAVSQADPRLQSVNTSTANNATTSPAQIQPGLVTQVGPTQANVAATTQFAYTRLATNVGPGTVVQPAGAVALQGYASAVAEHSDPNLNTVHAFSTTNLGDATINRTTANHNTFAASFALAPTSVGFLPSDPAAVPSPVPSATPVTLNFGDPGAPGATPKSAFISNSTFAALGGNGQPGGSIAMTSVDGDLLKGIAGQPAATGQPVTIAMNGAAVDASLPASNEHLAWGYFLGDLAAQANGAIQDHVNLGFWVAGQPVTFAMLQTLTGTATYGGGMIGTATQSGRIATVVGQFAQQWNFATRTGTMNAAFDSANWNGLALNMPGGVNVFTGTGSSSNIADRTLAVQGNFFHNTATGGALSAANLPAAVGGLFAIHNSTGTYGANGVLVGARR